MEEITVFDLMGAIAMIFLIVSPLFQVRKTLKDGHARGISWGSIVSTSIGQSLLLFYFLTISVDIGTTLIVLTGGSFLASIIVLAKKVFPTREKRPT